MTTTYTTTEKIRDEAGFKNNPHIIDTSIDIQRIRAYGVINSYVRSRYSLPSISDANFVDSDAHVLLSSIELILGAGYLLVNEYGREGLNTDKDGYRRIKDSEQMLADIRDNKIALFLKDGSLMPSVESQNSVTGTARSFPGTSVDPAYERRFSVGDKF